MATDAGLGPLGRLRGGAQCQVAGVGAVVADRAVGQVGRIGDLRPVTAGDEIALAIGLRAVNRMHAIGDGVGMAARLVMAGQTAVGAEVGTVGRRGPVGQIVTLVAAVASNAGLHVGGTDLDGGQLPAVDVVAAVAVRDVAAGRIGHIDHDHVGTGLESIGDGLELVLEVSGVDRDIGVGGIQHVDALGRGRGRIVGRVGGRTGGQDRQRLGARPVDVQLGCGEVRSLHHAIGIGSGHGDDRGLAGLVVLAVGRRGNVDGRGVVGRNGDVRSAFQSGHGVSRDNGRRGMAAGADIVKVGAGRSTLRGIGRIMAHRTIGIDDVAAVAGRTSFARGVGLPGVAHVVVAIVALLAVLDVFRIGNFTGGAIEPGVARMELMDELGQPGAVGSDVLAVAVGEAALKEPGGAVSTGAVRPHADRRVADVAGAGVGVAAGVGRLLHVVGVALLAAADRSKNTIGSDGGDDVGDTCARVGNGEILDANGAGVVGRAVRTHADDDTLGVGVDAELRGYGRQGLGADSSAAVAGGGRGRYEGRVVVGGGKGVGVLAGGGTGSEGPEIVATGSLIGPTLEISGRPGAGSDGVDPGRNDIGRIEVEGTGGEAGHAFGTILDREIDNQDLAGRSYRRGNRIDGHSGGRIVGVDVLDRSNRAGAVTNIAGLACGGNRTGRTGGAGGAGRTGVAGRASRASRAGCAIVAATTEQAERGHQSGS